MLDVCLCLLCSFFFFFISFFYLNLILDGCVSSSSVTGGVATMCKMSTIASNSVVSEASVPNERPLRHHRLIMDG